MKLSARNLMAGTIKAARPGATTTHITIELSPSVTITPTITSEVSEQLQLKVGMKAAAVIKASDVMVGRRLISRRHPPDGSPLVAATRQAGR
jgi:molybdopterin-binding protein